ncbi:MAG: Ig-like domain-containing protein [Gemmatimonadota bacterium]
MLVASLGATGCADLFGPDEGEIIALNPTIFFANGSPGETVGELLEIQLIDKKGFPRAGVEVVWRVKEGGGSVTPGTSVTDQDGVTSATWTLGHDGEYQKLTAKARKSRPFHFEAFVEGAGGGTDSGSTGTTDGSAGISPGKVTFAGFGATRTLVVTLPDGSNPAPEQVTWSSSNPDAITVDKAGVITAIAVGAAVVTAAVGDWSSTSNASVVAIGADGVLLREDYSQYSSTGHFMNDPFSLYTETEDRHPGLIQIDAGHSYDANGGSMRYDFPDRSLSDRRCNDYSIGRNLAFPELREIWVEAHVRFDRGWDTVAPTDWSCGSNPDYKLMGGRVKHWSGSTNGASRFGLKNGNGQGRRWEWVDPDGVRRWAGGDGSAAWDGEWHTVRLWMRTSSAPNVPDGGSALWVDGELMSVETNFVVNRRGVYGIYLGRNLNQGPARAQSIWWDDITVWARDPGWPR